MRPFRPFRMLIEELHSMARELKATSNETETRGLGRRLEAIAIELKWMHTHDPNMTEGYIYDTKFVARDYTTTRRMWEIVEPDKVAYWREHLEGHPDGWAPERPILVREEVGPLGGT